jgi:fermentation-respiration switch protein FrsA (DUF1100 family)
VPFRPGGAALGFLRGGDDDGMVPLLAAEKHFAAAKEPKRFLHGKDFGHCLGMKKNPEAYEPAMLELLDGVFAK